MGRLRFLVLSISLSLMINAVVGTTDEQSSSSFKDCYTKCFIFCMIEPSQTLCSCTTHCLKDCIFGSGSGSGSIPNSDNDHQHNLQLGKFCKLGCAFSICSAFTTKHNPDGDRVASCVGSCSNRCAAGYHPSLSELP
ncbi:thionin-like protein 2 [Andrographis paniculata]|uniref:thionin-like protein 2 n=1 Tax=Andrographis paniculata TaxID=175694 RepID=UPI0021E803B3|nr:thionin-like protein 2 [Andrographis paniculata]